MLPFWRWWQPNWQSNFLAVKPKTEGFNTILTTKLNDHVLIMASFETNNSKNWSLNTKKKKKKIPTQLLQDFGSVGKGQHNIFFFRPNNGHFVKATSHSECSHFHLDLIDACLSFYLGKVVNISINFFLQILVHIEQVCAPAHSLRFKLKVFKN